MQKMPSMPNGRKRSTAAKLKRAESGGGAGTLTVALVVAALLMFTLSAREGGTGFFSSCREVTQTVVLPLRVLGAGIMSPFSSFSNVVRNLTSDEKSLSELKADNERLAARNVELEEAEKTAQRLESLLELKSTYNLQSTAARVIAGSTDSWSATITIDKGTADGIRVGMPVTDENGAIGQVISSSGATSVVRLLSDESSSVSAMLQASRAQGMLEGSVDGTLLLSYIRTDQTVTVGDIVVTSGLGGVFPKGLPLGKVASVESAQGDSFYSIVVEPFAKADAFEEVMVITSLTEEQQASAEDIEQADQADLAALESSDQTDADTASETDAETENVTDGTDQGSGSENYDDTAAGDATV